MHDFLKGDALSDHARKNLSILDAIRRSGPISKTEISSLIGVNVVTVSNYIEEFLRQKLVFEKELDVSRGGRRPVLLDLNPDAGYAIGIGLNLIHATAVIVDMRGRTICEIKEPHSTQQATDVVEVITHLAKQVMQQAGDIHDKIRGIGVGVAGIIDSNRETVRWPQRRQGNYRYELIALPLKDTLEKEFNVPVCIDNDATVACFGEQWLAQEATIRDVLYMFSGAGCGIMINGEMYRGASGCAGELSIYDVDTQQDRHINPEWLYFLKRQEVDLGILRAMRIAMQGVSKQSILWNLCNNDSTTLTMTHVIEAVRQGDACALDVVKQAAAELGVKIALLVNVFNPQLVIIGGGLEQFGMPFIDEIRRCVSHWSFEETSSAVKIIGSRLGEQAVALGAANLIVREAFATVKE